MVREPTLPASIHGVSDAMTWGLLSVGSGSFSSNLPILICPCWPRSPIIATPRPNGLGNRSQQAPSSVLPRLPAGEEVKTPAGEA